MSSNSDPYQLKAEPKWQAVVSFVLGIISILAAAIVTYTSWVLFTDWFWCRLFPVLPVVGLVLGIMGLKYTKKRLAITGVILCSILWLTYMLYGIYSRTAFD